MIRFCGSDLRLPTLLLRGEINWSGLKLDTLLHTQRANRRVILFRLC